MATRNRFMSLALLLLLSIVAFGLVGVGSGSAYANGGGDAPTAEPTEDPDENLKDKIGDGYVRGPWLPIQQIFWVSSPNGKYDGAGTDDPYRIGGANDNHRMGGMMDRRYVPIKHSDCYPDADGVGPDADETNSIYLMTSCRLGKVVGVMLWSSIGVGILSLAWGGFMYVNDSGSGGERAGQIRSMVIGPIVGIGICLFAYQFAYIAYGALAYGFNRYLYDLSQWVPGL